MSQIKPVEVVAVLLVLLMLVMIACASQFQRKEWVQRCQCINNLRSVDGGLGQFWIDHNGWPMKISTNSGGTKEFTQAWQHYRALSNYFSAQTLVCPTDVRVAAKDWNQLDNGNISYFIATKFRSDENVIWAGDRNFTRISGDEVSLDSGEEFRWRINSGIHDKADFGVLLVQKNPEPIDSRSLLALLRAVSKTNSIQVAVP